MLQTSEGESKYKADCSNCKKSTMVPFEPKEGRPIYCKDCMFKIKSGELKADRGFVSQRSSAQEEKNSTAPLADLGIEFTTSNKKTFIPNIVKKTGTDNKKSIFINKNQDFNKTKQPFNNNSKIVERKHAGPSPLLKGFLEKIDHNSRSVSGKSFNFFL